VKLVQRITGTNSFTGYNEPSELEEEKERSNEVFYSTKANEIHEAYTPTLVLTKERANNRLARSINKLNHNRYSLISTISDNFNQYECYANNLDRYNLNDLITRNGLISSHCFNNNHNNNIFNNSTHNAPIVANFSHTGR
jgi:hypothetical protein